MAAWDLLPTRRHRSLQYLTCSQTLSHFFRHSNGRSQTTQFFVGKLDFKGFFIWWWNDPAIALYDEFDLVARVENRLNAET